MVGKGAARAIGWLRSNLMLLIGALVYIAGLACAGLAFGSVYYRVPLGGSALGLVAAALVLARGGVFGPILAGRAKPLSGGWLGRLLIIVGGFSLAGASVFPSGDAGAAGFSLMLMGLLLAYLSEPMRTPASAPAPASLAPEALPPPPAD